MSLLIGTNEVCKKSEGDDLDIAPVIDGYLARKKLPMKPASRTIESACTGTSASMMQSKELPGGIIARQSGKMDTRLFPNNRSCLSLKTTLILKSSAERRCRCTDTFVYSITLLLFSTRRNLIMADQIHRSVLL